MNGLENRVRRLEARRIPERDSVVSICHYPWFEGQGYSATMNGVTHDFASESELMEFVGQRRIGLFVPHVLTDAQWEVIAKG